LKQTYQSFEIIVVGDGHQQNVQELVNTYEDARISYHYVEHCGYPAKARNMGISKSKGDLVAFLDDDDLWIADKLEKQLSVMENNTSIVLCCTDRRSIDQNNKFVQHRNLRYKPKSATTSLLLVTNFISYSSVLASKKAILKANGFIELAEFKAVEDYHLWLKMSSIGSIVFLNDPLLLYRVHSSNISKSLVDGTKKVIDVYKDIFRHYRFSIFLKALAYTTVYTKYFLYKITE
jgi:glycosyltransferase involved in cell wall biosynthesis